MMGGMDKLSSREDKASRYTLEVMPNHPAMSDGGSQARRIYEEMDEATVVVPGDSSLESAAMIIFRCMYELALKHPAIPSLILIKAHEPSITIRDLAKRCLWGRSMAQDAVEQLARSQPKLRDILNPPTKRARAQSARRKRERGCHVPE
jgi:hypothetical protein